MSCSRGPPKWHYKAPDPSSKLHPREIQDNGNGDMNEEGCFPSLEGDSAMDLGSYVRDQVTNCTHEKGRAYFDLGLRNIISYQHEMAATCFIACTHYSPYCALAHALVALSHSPNYNFKGEAYYESTHRPEEESWPDRQCAFPSQQIADRYSRRAVEVIEEIRKLHRKPGSGKRGKKGKHKKSQHKTLSTDVETWKDDSQSEQGQQDLPEILSDIETTLIHAMRTLTQNPGVEASLSEELVGRPYANEMRNAYERFPEDPEVAYWFAEALMVLNAWQLYEYPSGKPLSPDVVEVREVLELSLQKHPQHAGLCHMYVHLSEMSSTPEMALKYCEVLRNHHAGHLVHMPTHIDVLVGDYERTVLDNCRAIEADLAMLRISPETAGPSAFYFGYMVHNYHFAAYGAIMGGFEAKAMEIAQQLLQDHLTEDFFTENPDLTSYLEAYSALDLHILVRFGRWEDILDIPFPTDRKLMFCRTATLMFARGVAYANKGDIVSAKKEADRFDSFRKDLIANQRILHNNLLSSLLAVDAPMLRGEIAYHEGRYAEAFKLLRRAVELQDSLAYDEPWGKMQPIRHALGGLLLERGHLAEASEVFREDLKFHPKNPFALVGLIDCLDKQIRSGLLHREDFELMQGEVRELREAFATQRNCEWADFNIQVACSCCIFVSDKLCCIPGT